MSATRAKLTHPSAQPACPDCRGVGFRVEAAGMFAAASLCDCIGECPVCRGTRFVRVGEGRLAPRRRCDCSMFEARLERYTEARIPSRYADATLASFDGRRRGRMACFVALNQYLKEFAPGHPNRGIVLHGEVGRGKTHLMVAVMAEMILRFGVTARFVEFSHLLADLKSGFGKGVGSGDLISPLSRVEVLAIDELGKGRNTEFEGTVVDELISRRYNSSGTLLATTNYGPGAPTGIAAPNLATAGRAAAATPLLVDRIGDRVYSRLRHMCDFIPVGGDDYREIVRRQP